MTNKIDRHAAAQEEREYCKAVLAWTVIGLILGLIINLAAQDTSSLVATEFVSAGIFFIAALIIEPILLARRTNV